MNLKSLFTASLSLLLFINVNIANAHEPTNLHVNKLHLIKYHDTNQYAEDQARIMNEALEYLKNRLKTAEKPNHFAIVLDIDETTLSGYDDMIKMDFGGTLKQIIAAENLGHSPAILATLKLYRYAKANHVAVFFVTGRAEDARVPTENNLNHVGFTHFDGLFLKPNDYKEKSASIFKTTMRTKIENEGYDIVLNIGDQKSDLVGKHADKTFKMPNPYYFVP